MRTLNSDAPEVVDACGRIGRLHNSEEEVVECGGCNQASHVNRVALVVTSNRHREVLLVQVRAAQTRRDERLPPEGVVVVRGMRGGLPVGFSGDGIAFIPFGSTDVANALTFDSNQCLVLRSSRVCVLLQVQVPPAELSLTKS